MKKAILVLIIALIGVLPVTAPRQAFAEPQVSTETRNTLLVSLGAIAGVGAAAAIFESLAAPANMLTVSGIGPIGILVSGALGGLFGSWVGSKI